MVLSNVHIIEQKEVKAAMVALRSDGIMHYTFNPVEDFTSENALEIFDAVKNIGNEKKYPVLLSVNKYMNIESDTRKLWANPAVNKYAVAEAMVLKNVAIKLIGNFYIQINKPAVPTQIFTSEKQAVEWLKTFL